MVVELSLTQDKIALIDVKDYERVNQYKWHAVKSGKCWYGLRNTGKKPNRSVQSLHRFIMDAKRGEYIDHRDGDGLNNQRENLRRCSNSENCMNRKGAHITSKTGIKGVTWHKKMSKWAATIGFNKKQIWVGAFDTIEEATRAYNMAAIKYHGEFANLNRIERR